MTSPFSRKESEQPNDIAAILCSDVHLSLKPPIARSAEPSWLKAMARPLKQLKGVQEKYGAPIICAGDIFDKWNAPAELINWALVHLPHMYAIPGQHDLPNHRYEDIRKSAFWTLIKSGKLTLIEPGTPLELGVDNKAIRLHGFPWGFPITPLKERGNLCLEVAVIHSYIWKKGFSYPGANEGSMVYSYDGNLEGYTNAVFGDNHLGFMNGSRLINCGGFMRRKADEKERPCYVGLLHSSGKISRVELDCSEDKWLESEATVEEIIGTDFSSFLKELSQLTDAAINFSEAIHYILEREKVPDSVKRIILTALETKQ